MKTKQLSLFHNDTSYDNETNRHGHKGGIWHERSGDGKNSVYTVLFCPQCESQKTYHSNNAVHWRCDSCGWIHISDAKRYTMKE